MSAQDLEQRARKLLAAEYIAAGYSQTGKIVMEGPWDAHPSIRAIAAALRHQPAPNGKLVGWWNGITPDITERSPYEPSVRWGADAEDSGHDIPLYDGYNPVHYKQPAPVDLEQFREAVEFWGKSYQNHDPSIFSACSERERISSEADRLLSIIDNAGKVEQPGTRKWMAEVCRAAAASLEAHGVLNEQLPKVADWIAHQPAPVVPTLPGNWPEDAGHENGDYECCCSQCGATFYGHKRRVVCRVCAKPAPVVDEWCRDYHCAGDCGMRGHGWQHSPVVFRNDGNSEADFIAHHADACTACGGSGHKSDQQPAPVVEDAMRELVEAGELVAYERLGEGPAKRWRDMQRFRAALARAQGVQS